MVAEHRGAYGVLVAAGAAPLTAHVTGRLRHDALGPGDFPVVGDWVAVDLRAGDGTASIHAVVSRRTRIQRRAPADHGAPMQVLAANVDVVMIATSLNRDLNARRLERFLATAWESGGRPIVVLTKVDLAANPVEVAVAEAQLEELAVGVRVLATSAVTGDGLDDVRQLLRPGITIALLGSSGVGKSTLINAILGEQRLATSEVRATTPGAATRPAAGSSCRFPAAASSSTRPESESSPSGTTAPALRPPSWTWRRPRPAAGSATAPTSGSPAVRSRQRS